VGFGSADEFGKKKTKFRSEFALKSVTMDEIKKCLTKYKDCVILL
jgi:hypothetical protein